MLLVYVNRTDRSHILLGSAELWGATPEKQESEARAHALREYVGYLGEDWEIATVQADHPYWVGQSAVRELGGPRGTGGIR